MIALLLRKKVMKLSYTASLLISTFSFDTEGQAGGSSNAALTISVWSIIIYQVVCVHNQQGPLCIISSKLKNRQGLLDGFNSAEAFIGLFMILKGCMQATVLCEIHNNRIFPI